MPYTPYKHTLLVIRPEIKMPSEDLSERINKELEKYGYEMAARFYPSGSIFSTHKGMSIVNGEIITAVYHNPVRIEFGSGKRKKNVCTRGFLSGIDIDGANFLMDETEIVKGLKRDLADILLKV